MTSTDADKLIAAARQATAERDRAREEAARLLTPDPVEVVANLLIELEMVRGDRGALAAALDDEIATATMRYQRDAANWYIGRIAVALGMSECSLSAAVRDRAKDLCSERDALAAETERLKSLLATAEKDAADVRAALDRVAKAAGVDSDSTGAVVADRVIAVLRAMQARPVLTVERLADALRAANVTLQPTTTAFAVMAAMSHMGDLVLPESSPTSRPAALPADLRTYLETRRDRLQGGHGLGLAAEIAALKRWIALPTAVYEADDTTGGGQ